MKKFLAVIMLISGWVLFSCDDPMEESLSEEIEFIEELPSAARGDVDVDAEVVAAGGSTESTQSGDDDDGDDDDGDDDEDDDDDDDEDDDDDDDDDDDWWQISLAFSCSKITRWDELNSSIG